MSDHTRITFDSLHHAERERLKALQHVAEVQLAKRYPQLKEIVVRHLLHDEMLQHPAAFHHIVSASGVEINPDDEKAI